MDIDWQLLGTVMALLFGVVAVCLMIAGWIVYRGSESASALRETAIHEMDNALIVMDSRDHALEVNPAASRYIRMEPAQAIGKTPDVLFDNCPSVLALFRRLTASDDPGGNQGEAIVKVGEQERFVELSVSRLLDRRGNKVGKLIVFHDITTLKQAQLTAALRLEEFAALREVDSQISSSLDINNVLQTALNFAIRICGADAGLITLTEGSLQRIVKVAGQYAESDCQEKMISLTTGIIGRAVQQMEAELVPDVSADPDYSPFLPDTCAQMTIPLMTHESVVGVVSLETSDPTRFTPEIFEFMKLLAGRIAGAIENAQLYTLSLKQVVELKTTYDQVRELEQIKTEMLRVASHDLKNPLNVIVGYLSLFEANYDQMPPDHQVYWKEITQQAERMMEIIQDILTLERLQGAVIYEPTDLQAIVSIALSDLATQAADKAQTVAKRIHPEPLIVNGDAAQLREAVTNLIGNAIKYTPDGGRITVCLEPSDGNLVFEVIDNGYGIPEDRQRRLFQPFYRAKVEGTEDIEGTGLGLHLAKNIIQRHSGIILFHSVYGTGSRFGFELPLSTS
jgi:PAS domain S-box-containing protein